MEEGVPLWSNASEVIEPALPCQAKEVELVLLFLYPPSRWSEYAVNGSGQ